MSRRWASPAPDGPGSPPGSYFDGGRGRRGWGRGQRCTVSSSCALLEGHGGCCDPRPEQERFQALNRLLEHGFEGDRLTEAVEAEARAATARVH